MLNAVLLHRLLRFLVTLLDTLHEVLVLVNHSLLLIEIWLNWQDFGYNRFGLLYMGGLFEVSHEVRFILYFGL